MTRKKKTPFQRIDINTVIPKDTKTFNLREVIKSAKRLQEAVRKEEELYGSLRNTQISSQF